MVSNDPHLVINLGDMHYAGVGGATSKYFLQVYHEVFKSQEMRNLYENYPLAYSLGGYDVGPNNANGLSHSTVQASIAY